MPKEYIDREKALEITKRTSGDYATAFSMIRQLPAADVVLVVRCKDCNHYTEFDPHNCKRLEFHFCNKFGNITREMDFCSYGEMAEEHNAEN